MIAVFPLKTGDLMFVGFDSHHPLQFLNWIPWVSEFPIISSETAQRISRGENCVICV
jgi:hypothetical protein